MLADSENIMRSELLNWPCDLFTWCRLTTLVALLVSSPAMAQIGPVPGDEGAIQSYLGMWSRNADITAAAVDRFYAPSVVYYGKRLSRAEVLADKLRYIRAWPVRRYAEVPGSIKAQCNADRSLCHVSVIMAWHRTGRTDDVSVGRARVAFDFVPADGTRKIARESARNL